jgi:hypothetical protein
MDIPTAVWGLIPRDPKDPELIQGGWVPSLEVLCGQVLASVLAKAADKPHENKDQLWLDKDWQNLRTLLHVNSFI